MTFINKLMKIAGKDNFSIDRNVSNRYIIRLCWKYGCDLIRGRLLSIGYRHISSKIFIGRKVIIIEKNNVRLGRNTKLHDGVYIDALSQEGVDIGKDVVIGRNSRIECTGSIKRIGRGIKIGDRTSFGSDCFFGSAGGIFIGNDVVAGQFIRFHSENHNYNDLGTLIKEQGESHEGIKIGDNCWIGAGAVFLDGAEVGDGCVIAANSVVTKKFERNTVIAGVPAKIIKKRGE